MIRFLVVIALGGGLAWWFMQKPPVVTHPPGIIVAIDPIQQDVKKEDWNKGNYTIRPLTEFHIKARVLSKSFYRFDREAELAPYDLALGWQQMSDSDLLKHIDLTQTNRWYYLSWDELPISPQDVMALSANMHIIAGTPEVEAALKNVYEGHIVQMDGYLVQAIAQDDWAWTSSLTRFDNGEKSCELVWVNSLTIENVASGR